MQHPLTVRARKHVGSSLPACVSLHGRQVVKPNILKRRLAALVTTHPLELEAGVALETLSSDACSGAQQHVRRARCAVQDQVPAPSQRVLRAFHGYLGVVARSGLIVQPASLFLLRGAS